MNKNELIAVYTTDHALVPLKFVESMREVTDNEQRVVDKLANESRIDIRTISGNEHTIKATDMKRTIESITNTELTPVQVNETIITIWLQVMRDNSKSTFL